MSDLQKIRLIKQRKKSKVVAASSCWSHVEDEVAQHARGDTEVWAVWLSERLAPHVRRKIGGSREVNTSLSGSCRVWMGQVEFCKFYILVITLRCMDL